MGKERITALVPLSLSCRSPQENGRQREEQAAPWYPGAQLLCSVSEFHFTGESAFTAVSKMGTRRWKRGDGGVGIKGDPRRRGAKIQGRFAESHKTWVSAGVGKSGGQSKVRVIWPNVATVSVTFFQQIWKGDNSVHFGGWSRGSNEMAFAKELSEAPGTL